MCNRSNSTFKTNEPVREVCKIKFSGILVALDRMESSSRGVDAIAEFKITTGIPVWSIITIRELCVYLKNRIVNGNVLLNDTIYEEIEQYLEENCIR